MERVGEWNERLMLEPRNNSYARIGKEVLHDRN